MCLGKNAHETGVYISEELLVNILKRLPVKSLLRFLSVCQSWYSLIKNPDFISTHLSHQIAISNQSGLGYQLYNENVHMSCRFFVHCDNESFDRTQELIFPQLPRDSAVFIPRTCNGIVCLGHNQRMNAVLWNPSLRKLLCLNIPHTVGPTTGSLREPGSSNVSTFFSFEYGLFHGIGFDSSSNDYKFVSIAKSLYTWGTRFLSVCVYSLNKRAWRRLNSEFVPSGQCSQFRGVTLNGAIHWLLQDSYPVSILRFNFADETFSEIPLPEGIFYSQDRAGLMSAQGRNGEESIACLHMDEHWNFINLWVMEIYGVKESWRLAVSLSGQRDGFKSIVNVRQNGEILVELEGGRLGSLNPRDMSLEVVSDNHRSMADIGPYIETLVLL